MPPLLTLPSVDGVEITTIMDNSLDLIMSSTTVAHRFPLPHYGFTRPQLRAEHGVSLLITVIDQGRRETILFDTGVTPDGALHNLAVLGIDLNTIQAIVLSHGHTDHTHGLDGFLDKLGKQRMPIYFIQMLSSNVVLSTTILASWIYHLLHCMTLNERE
jgi:7,8-dihydropterin-6-yl-methyl-4-(beta-D-ribofuranosyl)aminobenzene 5'-phosphate synthase